MADPAADGAEPASAIPHPDPLWDDWDTPPRIPGIPELHLAGFEGPMDLLLDLAERQRIDLGGISILQLAEQFVAAMTRLERRVTLERRADWMVMATRLLLLRSRLLFPASPTAEADAAQDAGREIGRLDQMLVVRAVADWLELRPQLGRDVFPRGQIGRSPRVTSYMALMEACLFVLRGKEDQPGAEPPVYRLSPPALFRVDAAMARIRALLAGQPEQGEIDFARCLPAVGGNGPHRDLRARSAVASSLIAVLELVRGGEVIANQTEPAASILLRKPDNSTHPA